MSKLFDEKEFLRQAQMEFVERSLKHILWVRYDFNVLSSRPLEYGRYFVMRKDGKVHWEVWNGASWAYNENSIMWWAKIELPQ